MMKAKTLLLINSILVFLLVAWGFYFLLITAEMSRNASLGQGQFTQQGIIDIITGCSLIGVATILSQLSHFIKEEK